MPTALKSSILLAFAAAVSLFLFFEYFVVHSPTIIASYGEVSVYDRAAEKWTDARNGRVLARGDAVRTADDAFVDLQEPGRYTIRLKANSELEPTKALPRYTAGDMSYYLKKGKALIVIEKGFERSLFKVKTPIASAGVRGTKFLVGVDEKKRKTRVGVLEGRVTVASLYRPKDPKTREVLVVGGEATDVYPDEAPRTPRQLFDREWGEMAEFYQFGQKTQVALLISDSPRRTRELLRPCPLYISDVEPRTVAVSLEETIRLIDEAVKTKDRAKHLQGIKMLEEVLVKHPSPAYEPQLLLFIGAYYSHIEMYEDAVRSFAKVSDLYPESTFASIALYAAGIVYDEKMHDAVRANDHYRKVLELYPVSPEAEAIRRR